MATTRSLNTTQAGEQITREDYSWSKSLYEPTKLTYAYRASIPADYIDVNKAGADDFDTPVEADTFKKFTDSQIAVSEIVFKLFEEVCGISFTRVADASGYSNKATILLGNYSNPDASDIYGYSYQVQDDQDRSSGSNIGDFWYNLDGPNANGNNPKIAIGSDDYNTLIHELGHSLGLDHPSDYPDGFTYDKDAYYIQDSLQYTVMSYFDAAETGADFKGQYLKTLGLHDIAALQRLYGANTETRAGNDTYGFGGKGVYGLSSAKDKTVFSIWDAGGKDTLNFSKYSNTQTIDLHAEKFSSVGGLKLNVSIAKGVVIENAVGGSGKDTMIGNDAANSLSGGKGQDTLNGNGGNDRLVGGADFDRMDGGKGSDTADYSAFKTPVNVTLKGSAWALVQNDEEISYDGIRNVENVSGGAGDDTLVGDGATNRLLGNGGIDYIDGAGGSDVLGGGGGRDFFLFGAATLGKLGLDLILDFNKGDKLTLIAETFGGFDEPDGPSGIAKGDFSSGSSLKSMGKGDHLFFDTDDALVYYDNDGAGTGRSAIKFAEIDNGYKIGASDFLIA